MTPRAIVTDIEGTTSSISFVKDVLFPYARKQLPAFVRKHGKEPEVRRWLDAAAVDAGGVCTDDTLIETLQGWIDTDYKHTALKALQGMIWEQGYKAGDFPVTEKLAGEILSLPMYPQLRKTQQERVVDVLQQFKSISEQVLQS